MLTLASCHPSVTDQMQLADELPMIYTTCIIGYTSFAYGKSRAGSLGVAATFFGIAFAITVSDPRVLYRYH